MVRRFSAGIFSLLGSLGVAALLAGCGAIVPTHSGPLPGETGSFTMSGTAYGGFQPITGGTINLYSAGSGGYGVGAALRATTTTNGSGSFSFTKSLTNSDSVDGTNASWACPTTGDPLIYLVATGGNPTGNGMSTPTNSGIALLTPLGLCSTVSADTHVKMNEVITVASVAALQQFLNPATRSIGSSNSPLSIQALTDAYGTVANLVDVTTGSALGSFTKTNAGGYNVSGVTITVTPETAKLNTIANILATCVNSDPGTSASCATLYANAVPTNPLYTSQPGVTFGTATDTLMAAYYMFTNPTSGAAANGDDPTKLLALYNLPTAYIPFGPSLTDAPTDWTVGIRYDAGSAKSCGGTNAFLKYIYHVAVDENGNIWGVNAGNNTLALSELSPTGQPLSCAVSNIVGASALTNSTIDINGHIWFSDQVNSQVTEWDPNTNTYSYWTATAAPLSVGSDGNGNIFYAYNAHMMMIPAVLAQAGNPAPTSTYGSQIGGTVRSQPDFMAIDKNGAIYSSYQGSTTASYEALFQTYPSTDSDSLDGYKTVSYTSGGTNYINNYGFAVGKDGAVWSANGAAAGFQSANTWTKFTPDPTTLGTGVVSAPTAQGLGGLLTPREIAADGAGNLFSVNAGSASGSYVTGASGYTCATGSTTNPNTCWAIAEIAYDGTPISASGNSTSLSGTTYTTTITGGFQKDHTIMPYYGRGVAITPSGNVWFGSNSSNGLGVTELVGQAVPVVTPLSKALALGDAVAKP